MTRIDEERLRVADAIVDGLGPDGFGCLACNGDEDGTMRAWLAEHIARYKHLRALVDRHRAQVLDWDAWRRQLAEDDREPLYPTKDGDK